jgi:hypothetical protein
LVIWHAINGLSAAVRSLKRIILETTKFLGVIINRSDEDKAPFDVTYNNVNKTNLYTNKLVHSDASFSWGYKRKSWYRHSV